MSGLEIYGLAMVALSAAAIAYMAWRVTHHD
jgi:hypothetical protein